MRHQLVILGELVAGIMQFQDQADMLEWGKHVNILIQSCADDGDINLAAAITEFKRIVVKAWREAPRQLDLYRSERERPVVIVTNGIMEEI